MDPVECATCVFAASRSAAFALAGTSALSSGPFPPSLQRLPTTTSVVLVATVASPADRSPYKSSDLYGLHAAAAGNFSCRRQGNLIVVDQLERVVIVHHAAQALGLL